MKLKRLIYIIYILLRSCLLRDADDYFCLQQHVTPQESHQQELRRPPKHTKSHVHTRSSLAPSSEAQNQQPHTDKARTFLPGADNRLFEPRELIP